MEGLKFLVVSYYFPPNGPFTGYARAYEIAKFLKAEGHSVHVFTMWKPTDEFPHTFVENQTNLNLRKGKSWLKYIGWPDRHVGFFLKGFPKFKELMRTFAPDMVFMSVPPFSTALFSLILPKGSFVIDFRDVWSADNLQLYRTPLQRYLSLLFERYCINKSLFSTCTNENACRYLREKHSTDRVYTLEHFYEDQGCPDSSRELSICYLGSLENVYALEDVIPHLLERGFRVKLVGYIREKLKLEGVEYHPPMDIPKLHAWVCRNCSALLVCLKPYRNHHLVLMNKSVYYLSFNKPILAYLPEKNPAYVLYRSLGNIYLSTYGNLEEFLENVENLKEDLLSGRAKYPPKPKMYSKESFLERFQAILGKHLSRAL